MDLTPQRIRSTIFRKTREKSELLFDNFNVFFSLIFHQFTFFFHHCFAVIFEGFFIATHLVGFAGRFIHLHICLVHGNLRFSFCNGSFFSHVTTLCLCQRYRGNEGKCYTNFRYIFHLYRAVWEKLV